MTFAGIRIWFPIFCSTCKVRAYTQYTYLKMIFFFFKFADEAPDLEHGGEFDNVTTGSLDKIPSLWYLCKTHSRG